MNNQPTPVAVQQTTVIQVGSQKSVAGAVLLALFFGPLGMIYATIPGALIMFVINIFVVFVTLGLGLLITLPICAIWAGIAASNHNKRLGVSSQQAALAGQASPAGWHPDPSGSGRLRYYDGIRWTDHYAQHADPQPEPAAEVIPEAPQLEQPAAEEPEATVEEPATEVVDEPDEVDSEAPTQVAASRPEPVFCGSCGAGISPAARFCSACGESQALAPGGGI
ncbi:MAG TPA: DUF2510 domain-containing protein [Solirubrobacterales bacterium]|nr:DUF2510 domain-containing protein [Solirubrobacterales bacterium]